MSAISTYLRMAFRWKWLISVITLTCTLTSGLVSLQLPKLYATQTEALVSPKQVIQGTGTDQNTNPNAIPNVDQLVETYVGLINSEPVRRGLVQDGVPRQADQLLNQILARRVPNTTLVSVQITDTDPAVALLIARDILPAFNRSLNELQNQVPGIDQSNHLQALVPWDVPNRPPTTPISPNIPQNVLMAFGAGLVAALILAFVLERVDNTVKVETDVVLRLNRPLLASILYRATPKRADPAKEAVEVISATHLRDPLSEQYRALRTNLLFTQLDNESKTVVVTSAVPGEGKTTTATNLAVVTAQAGHRVILVDADFRRPALQDIFGRGRGLGSLVLETHPDDEIIRETDVPNLSVVCGGPSPVNPSEVLGSSSMDRAIQRMTARADVVIFDTPPITAVTDATVLGALTDGMILVVEQGRASIPTIQRAIETVDAVGVRIYGIVLNKAKSGDGAHYYYYGDIEDDMPTGGKPESPASLAGQQS